MSFLITGYKLTLDYNIKHKYVLGHTIYHIRRLEEWKAKIVSN